MTTHACPVCGDVHLRERLAAALDQIERTAYVRIPAQRGSPEAVVFGSAVAAVVRSRAALAQPDGELITDAHGDELEHGLDSDAVSAAREKRDGL